jgi:hypothetical protein
MNDFFIAVYTTYAKRYCDHNFFKRLGEISGDEYVSVIDNSQYTEYTKKLETLCENFVKNYSLKHLNIEPGERLFLRSVGESVIELQKEFLQSDKKYFLIIESDVLPPIDLLNTFRSIIDAGDAIGGIYYPGPHLESWFDPEHSEIVSNYLVLSGCTLYKRSLMSEIPFRIDLNNPNAFPDAYMYNDSTQKGYKCVNYTGIKCVHMHDANGGRGHQELC